MTDIPTYRISDEPIPSRSTNEDYWFLTDGKVTGRLHQCTGGYYGVLFGPEQEENHPAFTGVVLPTVEDVAQQLTNAAERLRLRLKIQDIIRRAKAAEITMIPSDVRAVDGELYIDSEPADQWLEAHTAE